MIRTRGIQSVISPSVTCERISSAFHVPDASRNVSASAEACAVRPLRIAWVCASVFCTSRTLSVGSITRTGSHAVVRRRDENFSRTRAYLFIGGVHRAALSAGPLSRENPWANPPPGAGAVVAAATLPPALARAGAGAAWSAGRPVGGPLRESGGLRQP